MDKIFNVEKIMNFCNYVYWFFVLNLLFMIFNIPIVLYFIFLGYESIHIYLPLFLVCLLPVGPSFTAVLYTMGKIIKYKDISVFKDFFHGLKINFIQSITFWIIELSLIFILYTNFNFFNTQEYGKFLLPIFLLISIILILLTPIIYILISRFKMNNLQLFKTALTLCITKPILTFSNIVAMLFFLMLFELAPSYTVLVMVSGISFLMLFMNKSLLIYLENISS